MGSIWRVVCQTKHHPGQWETWYRSQCCAVGWPPPEFKYAENESSPTKAWTQARNRLREMNVGDSIVAMLPGGRIGRVGEIVRVKADDMYWDPVVQPSNDFPSGENGRRIEVRWNLSLGPSDPNVVVLLPPGRRDFGQHAISSIRLNDFDFICETMKDRNAWVSLHSTFNLEKALSDYIAMHPHRLSDDLITHPSLPVREYRVSDRSRIDVVLQDSQGVPVLVECKQNGAESDHIRQLSRYMEDFKLRHSTMSDPKGILVHGGSRKPSPDVQCLVDKNKIFLVHHELRVDFS